MSKEELYGVMCLAALVLERARKVAEENRVLTAAEQAELKYTEARLRRAMRTCPHDNASSCSFSPKA